MNYEPNDDFEARMRFGVPLVRTAACALWSETRCARELEELMHIGSKILVQAAVHAASHAEFFDRLHGSLRAAMRDGAGAATASMTTMESEDEPGNRNCGR